MIYKRNGLRRLIAALAFGACFAVSPLSVGVASAKEASLAREGGVGLVAALASLVYGPVKVVYAVGGLGLSAATLLWTFDTDIAGPLFTQTVGGDYVVTPSHVTGDSELNFFGR